MRNRLVVVEESVKVIRPGGSGTLRGQQLLTHVEGVHWIDYISTFLSWGWSCREHWAVFPVLISLPSHREGVSILRKPSQ